MDSTKLKAGGAQIHARGRGRSRLLPIDPFVLVAIALLLIGLLMLAFSNLVSPSRAGNGLHCGQFVTHDVTLTHDLIGCPENGLVVGRSGITIDLNGHTMTGLGEGFGILLSGVNGVRVFNGAVHGFEYGMRLHNATSNRVADLNIGGGSDAGVWMEASRRNLLSRLRLAGNGDDGIRVISSAQNRFADNTISGVSDSGVGLEVGSNGNRLVGNKVTFSGEGIKIDGGAGNRIRANTTSHNGGAGIEISSETFNTRVNVNESHRNGGDGIYVEGQGTEINGNRTGCNGGFGIKAMSVISSGHDNWAGGNGDNLGCEGVVCRWSATCGTE